MSDSFLKLQRLYSLNMLATRSSRILIVIAAITVILLPTLWHNREHLPLQSYRYINGYSTTYFPLTLRTVADYFGTYRNRPSFYDIGTKFGTDKVTRHHYQQMYEHRLAPFRDRRIKMLEIGLGCNMDYGPGASYHTWLEYFSDVDLYYIEYDAECAAKWANRTERATVFAGDQANIAFLNKFLHETGGNFDIIIDDGGHTMNQQKTSLNVLWRSIKPGGVYFIEDLGTSYSRKHGGNGPDSTMNVLKTMLDEVNSRRAGVQFSAISSEVISFEFTQECVALTKSKLPDLTEPQGSDIV